LAGARRGLGGDRSSLFFDATRIIKEMLDATNGTFPRVTIWENVPGALSSNGGADFRTVLTALDDVGSLGSWWYVLDAQYFGVPQRRRRVFVVSVFDSAILERAGNGSILAVGEGRRRNPAKGRKSGQDATATLGDGFEIVGGEPAEIVGALCARDFKGVGNEYAEQGKVVVQDAEAVSESLGYDPGVIGPLTSTGMSRARGTESVESNHVLVFTAQRVGEMPRVYDDVSPSLLSRMGTGGNNTPMIVEPDPSESEFRVVEGEPVVTFRPGTVKRFTGGVWEDIAPTLMAEGKSGDNETYMVVEEEARPIAFDSFDNGCSARLVDVSPPIRIKSGPPAVAVTEDENQNPIVFDGYNQSADDSGVYRTLRIGIDSGDCIAVTEPASEQGEWWDGSDVAATLTRKSNDQRMPDKGHFSAVVQTVTVASDDQVIPIHDQATRWSRTSGDTGVGKGNGLGIGEPGDPMNTLTSADRHAVAVNTVESVVAPIQKTIVRRLSPLECERLMGWDDFHTLHRADGKTNSDTTRYRMCGNGVASPVAQWIAEQIRPLINPEEIV
jgi:site-specific DNA-cytosine methylase